MINKHYNNSVSIPGIESFYFEHWFSDTGEWKFKMIYHFKKWQVAIAQK